MTKAASRLTLLLLLAFTGLPGLVRLSAGQATSRQPFAKMPASARKLIAIKVTGSKRYRENTVAAASGLLIGATVNEDDFKKASRHLGDMGVFTDVAYTFSYSSAGTKLELQVTDAPRFVPARFEDFVWFSDAEIRKRIQQHSPLFEGELPLAGRLADEVSDVLQAMLVEGGIPGHVEYFRAGKADVPVESINYHVNDVLIQVRDFEFEGAAAAELPALKAAAERLPDNEYSRTRLNLLVQRQLLPVYQARGYLKAQFGEPVPKVVKLPGATLAGQPDDGPRNQTLVDVTFAVTPGVQYRLKSFVWSGNHEFPTETLEKMVVGEPGQAVNTIRLADNLKDVQKLYGLRGYVTATTRVNAEFDDTGASVTMHLDLTEGAVYHMGDLQYRGLDNSLTAKLRAAWKLRSGDVYDAGYLSEYLPAAQKLLPPTLDWEVSPHVTANVREKTVDVDLIYSVRAPK